MNTLCSHCLTEHAAIRKGNYAIDTVKLVTRSMFGGVIDKISYRVRNSALNPWRNSRTVPPTPKNSVENLMELAKGDSNTILPRDCPVQTEKRVYKRSDPIDIVYPKATWVGTVYPRRAFTALFQSLFRNDSETD
ncbi:hypothetical protein RB195_026085 [Necator americanus]|uniref:Uncharacterized protein n=1 Tax=Necator americanus TaxID=51031 RepID=A0ABR1EVE8_NECAM